MTSCIFCDIIQGKIKGEVLRASNNFVALKDIHPVSPGHLLVIPKKHYGTLLDIPQSLAEELLKFTKDVANDMLNMKQGDGFNIIMNNLAPAGQVVPHAHIHVIPRKEDDGIRFLTKV